MSFYSHISQYYDEIFPVDQSEMSFVNKQIDGCCEVLDIGCGTGNKTAHLAADGRRVTAIDGDPAMIAEAKRSHMAPGISYMTGDMRAISGMFPQSSFDAVLCLGNTLVHLTRPDDIALMISQISSLLKKGGICIIQILNYDRILGRKSATT